MSFYCCCCLLTPLRALASAAAFLRFHERSFSMHHVPASLIGSDSCAPHPARRLGLSSQPSGCTAREQADLTRHIKPTRAEVLSLEFSENCAFVSWHHGALYLLWLMRGKDGLCSLPDPAACLGLGNPVWLMHQYQ